MTETDIRSPPSKPFLCTSSKKKRKKKEPQQVENVKRRWEAGCHLPISIHPHPMRFRVLRVMAHLLTTRNVKKISDIHVPLAHSLSDRHAHGNKEPLHPICLSLSLGRFTLPRPHVLLSQTNRREPAFPSLFPNSFPIPLWRRRGGEGGDALHYNQLGPLWVIIPLVFFGWFLSWRIHKDTTAQQLYRDFF